MKFLRHAGAADNAASLKNLHSQSRHGEVGRACQAVMAGADYDHIEIGHGIAIGWDRRPGSAGTSGYSPFGWVKNSSMISGGGLTKSETRLTPSHSGV